MEIRHDSMYDISFGNIAYLLGNEYLLGQEFLNALSHLYIITLFFITRIHVHTLNGSSIPISNSSTLTSVILLSCQVSTSKLFSTNIIMMFLIRKFKDLSLFTRHTLLFSPLKCLASISSNNSFFAVHYDNYVKPISTA